MNDFVVDITHVLSFVCLEFSFGLANIFLWFHFPAAFKQNHVGNGTPPWRKKPWKIRAAAAANFMKKPFSLLSAAALFLLVAAAPRHARAQEPHVTVDWGTVGGFFDVTDVATRKQKVVYDNIGVFEEWVITCKLRAKTAVKPSLLQALATDADGARVGLGHSGMISLGLRDPKPAFVNRRPEIHNAKGDLIDYFDFEWREGQTAVLVVYLGENALRVNHLRVFWPADSTFID